MPTVKGEGVGERLRVLRGARPQRMIAEAVGVQPRTYQRWEAEGGVSWANAEKLAGYFGVEPIYVLFGASSEDEPTLTEKVAWVEDRLKEQRSAITKVERRVQALEQR